MERGRHPDDLTDSNDLDTDFVSFEQRVAHVSYAASGPPLPRVGQRIGGKYRIDGRLGRGGMGAVFSVTHLGTGRPFAIKWLLPNLAAQPGAVQRFRREARASGKIVHPNVIQVYDIGDDGDAHFIVMELVRGVTLAQRLRERGRFDIAETCRVLIPVMRGVHAAHLAGVVHRDIKPLNIMLAQNVPYEEVPKVLDFGISKVVHASDTLHALSTHGAMIGTPHYMSLEQLRSTRVDARSDVYALGVVAYRMLSGGLPFTAQNYADLVCQILGQTAPPLDQCSGIPTELARVIAKAMSVEPDDRFASVEAMAHAFEPFAGGLRFAPRADLHVVDDDAATAVAKSSEAADKQALGLGHGPRRASSTPSRATDTSIQRAHPGALLVSGWLFGVALLAGGLWIVASSYLRGRTPPEAARGGRSEARTVAEDGRGNPDSRDRDRDRDPWKRIVCAPDAGGADCAIAEDPAAQDWESPTAQPTPLPVPKPATLRKPARRGAPREANARADPLLIQPDDFR